MSWWVWGGIAYLVCSGFALLVVWSLCKISAEADKRIEEMRREKEKWQ